MGRQPCCAKEGLNRGAWTIMEDKTLTDYIQLHGPGNWRNLPQRSGLKRCGKSCRLRWINYLRPDIKRGNITDEEEDLIIRLHKLLGNKWSLIAGRLPGRTDNEIKNYWNTSISRKLHAAISSQSSGRKANHPKKNANPAVEETNKKNSLAIRTKPRRLCRPLPFKAAKVGSSTAGEGSSSSNNHENAGELIPNESEPSEFMKDLEIDEKFMLEILNMEFEGSHDQQQFSPCGNESNGNSSSPPDSDDHSGGVLFSDEMLKEYSASLIDPESDWLQDYYIQNAHD